MGSTEISNWFQANEMGDLQAVLKYISDGRNPYVVDNEGRTALFYTISGGHNTIIKYLMRAAPGIQLILTKNRTSVLQAAISFGTPEVIHEILTCLPKAFKDSLAITQKTLDLLLHSQNALLSPEELANRRADEKILAIIKKFKQSVIRLEHSEISTSIILKAYANN